MDYVKAVWEAVRVTSAWVLCCVVVPIAEEVALRIAPKNLPPIDQLEVFGRYPFP